MEKPRVSWFEPSDLVVSQVRLALLQLKGLEDSYSEQLSFPRGRLSFNALGFM